MALAGTSLKHSLGQSLDQNPTTSTLPAVKTAAAVSGVASKPRLANAP